VGVRDSNLRSYGRTFTSVILVAAAVTLAAIVWELADAARANRDNPAKWVYLIRMTYLMSGLLLVTLGLLAIRSIRWISRRFKSPPKVEPTPLDSAWEEAGRRFELPDDDEDEFRPDSSDI